MTLQRGWRQRRADADARRADRAAAWEDERSDIRRQRAALAESARLEAEAAAAAREAEIRTAVTVCPCCAGKGHAPVIEAATIIDAVERYKATGWRPSPATVAQLLKDTFIVDRHGERIDPATATETKAQAPADPKSAKAPRRTIVPPFLSGDD